MFKHKYFIVMSLLAMLCIVTISSASAVDLNGTDDAISDNVNAIEDSVLEEVESDDSVLEVSDSENILEVSDEDELSANYKYFSDIQYKINSANSGDTVEIDNGTYYGFGNPIIINKPIKLVGLGDGVTLRANTNTNLKQCAVYINSSDVTIDNFIVTYGCYQWGGGIFINCLKYDYYTELYYYSTLYKSITISNCQFKDNSADGNRGYGGAICYWTENSLITNCTFINNHCTDYGGAIYANGLNNKISNCKFYYNYVSNELSEDSDDGLEIYRGGGAIYSDCQSLNIDNCSFDENYAREAWGGALRLSASGRVQNSTFKDNFAILAKAVYAGSDILIFKGNIFSLDYKEDPDTLFEGITSEDLKPDNTFNKTRIDSSVTFSAGMIFEYATFGTIMVTVDGGIIDINNIKVIGHPEAKITFKDNVITVSDLAVGKYTLRVTTTPDDDHYSVDSELSITVKKATAVIKASSTTVALKKGTAWAITLVNSKTGKPIVNMALTLKVYTGSKYKTVKVTTNSKGVATFKTGSLAKGNHKIVVSGTHSGYSFNTLTSSIKVIKPTALKFKLHKRVNNNKGSLITYQVLNKKTKKGVNGIKVEFKIYTGKTYKTITLKTKKVGKYKGIAGFFTNEYSVGKHKVVIVPTSIKYDGSGKTTIVIKSSAKKYPSKTTKS